MAEGADNDCQLVLDHITWRDQALVRLFSSVGDMERDSQEVPQSLNLAKATNVR